MVVKPSMRSSPVDQHATMNELSVTSLFVRARLVFV